MSNWYSAGQLAKMKLPGLPGSERGMTRRVCKDGWLSRQVKAKGGKQGIKTEYFVPAAYRHSLTISPQIAADAPVKISNKPVAPAPGTVTLTLTVSLTEATYITGWLAEQAQK